MSVFVVEFIFQVCSDAIVIGTENQPIEFFLFPSLDASNRSFYLSSSGHFIFHFVPYSDWSRAIVELHLHHADMVFLKRGLAAFTYLITNYLY